MEPTFSRREVLKLGIIGAASIFASPALTFLRPDDEDLLRRIGRARIATQAIYIYQQPDFTSDRNGLLRRDQIIPIYEEVISEYGPAHNPRWYQTARGYVHSAYLQRVDHASLCLQIMEDVPDTGCLGEVTVAYTDTLRLVGKATWLPLYRLYYQSVHWITGIGNGPDNQPWYQITDDLLHVPFHIPATHMRPLQAGELTPISPKLAEEQKRIEINLDEQTLTAFEDQEVVLHTKVSTGIPTKGESPNGIPTDTPRGRFHIQTKMPSRHMGDGELTNDIEAYELLGVPWVCVFHVDGLALHGTYWHNNFGRRMSHGCVNLRNRDALWLYRWTTPVAGHQDWYSRGLGTRIDII